MNRRALDEGMRPTRLVHRARVLSSIEQRSLKSFSRRGDQISEQRIPCLSDNLPTGIRHLRETSEVIITYNAQELLKCQDVHVQDNGYVQLRTQMESR